MFLCISQTCTNMFYEILDRYYWWW